MRGQQQPDNEQRRSRGNPNTDKRERNYGGEEDYYAAPTAGQSGPPGNTGYYDSPQPQPRYNPEDYDGGYNQSPPPPPSSDGRNGYKRRNR